MSLPARLTRACCHDDTDDDDGTAGDGQEAGNLREDQRG